MGKSNTGTCRGADCGQEFLWAVNEDTGGGVPLNRDPDPRGKYVEVGVSDDGRMIVRRLDRGVVTDEPRFSAHGVTCPNAGDFKRDRK